MGIYNVHAGHCPYKKGAYGAVGILNESNEARAVKNEVISLLKENGNTVYDCTCEENTTQNGCLQKIVAKCNEHDVDLDISIHLNSGRNDYKGDDSTGGVEVYCYDSKTYEVAKKIAENIGKEFGYRLRSDGTTSYAGVKKDSSLYVLKNTKANAILIECCFVDDADDAKLWDAKKCAKAIVEGILNKQVSSETVDPTPAPQPTKPQVSSNIDIRYAVMIEGGKILPEVKNLEDYAGIKGKKIVGLVMKPSQGSIKYRVTTVNGKTYPFVTGYNWSDANNGWAGDGRNAIATVEAYLYSPNGDKYIYYRVSPVNKDYYPYQRDMDKGSGMDGYAGSKGVAIDRFQAYIK